MALQSLLSFFVLALLVVEPRSAYGSSRGPYGWGSTAPMDPQQIGICASSVIIHGYKCQEIDVTTKDGYILNLQRITQGRVASTETKNKPPVLIQHGVLVRICEEEGEGLECV